MSTSKFGLITAIEDGNRYKETEGIKSLLEGKELVGYFPENTNITYSELEKYGDNESWIICYPDSLTGEYKVETFGNTEEMELSLTDLVKKTYHEKYIRIYNVKDMEKL